MNHCEPPPPRPALLETAGRQKLRRFTQSIHLNPDTDEGREILSVLLAVPPYQRGALLRAILFDHLRRAALGRWPGITPKTPDEITGVLAARRPGRSRAIPGRVPLSGPVACSSVHGPVDAPDGLDLEVRLDQLRF